MAEASVTTLGAAWAMAAAALLGALTLFAAALDGHFTARIEGSRSIGVDRPLGPA